MRPRHWPYTVPLRLRTLFLRTQADHDLDDELRDHIARKAEEYVAKGLLPTEARRQALIELRGIEQTKEACRDARSIRWLQDLAQDLQFGLRMLRKSPGFTIVAVLTLALGIGANTAMFSVVEGVVISPLPYRNPDRLVFVLESNARFPIDSISYPNFLDWQRTAHAFDRMAAFTWQDYDLTSPGTPEHLDGAIMSAGFFDTLGTTMALGRDFSPQEDRWGRAPVAIISNRLWRDRFGRSLQVLGKSVTLNGTAHSIVGVLPAGFRFGHQHADVYTPFGQIDPAVFTNRAGHYAVSIARLKPGVDIAQAQAEMSTIQRHLDQLYPDADRGTGAAVAPLKSQLVGDVTGTLFLLLGAVGLVLLIACANVANLVLARSTVRIREFAVRSALGASRARLTRQLLTESVLLSIAGAFLGLAFAEWGVRAVLAALPGRLPRSENIGVNGAVLLFTAAVSIIVGILFGLAPALRNAKTDLQAALREGGRGSSGVHHRTQNSLVIVQMALTVALLAGAGLLFRTIRHMWQTDPGFELQHAIAFRVGLPSSLLKTPASTRMAYSQLVDRIRRIPGVQAAGLAELVPLSGQDDDMPFWFDSQKPASLQDAPRVLAFFTGPGYLSAMKIPLLRGRFFTADDSASSPCVAVVDTVFVSMYLGAKNPVGEMISAGFVPIGPCRIVGVVGHVRHWSLGNEITTSGPDVNTRDQVYFSLYQVPDSWVSWSFAGSTIIARTSLDTVTLLPAVKSAIYAAGREPTVYAVHTMQQIASESMSSERFPMVLLAIFAGLALALASIGIYGVIAYSMTQRVHEIGVRMALGAEKSSIFRMIIGQGLRLAGIGLATGLAAAVILNRLLSSFSHLLYGVGTADPLTFAVVSLVLTGVAVVACYIPARRAMRVNPIAALRHE